MFVEIDATTRVCSTCDKKLPVDRFYKDGLRSDGSPRYRRDCKECYRVTRLQSRRIKRGDVKPGRKPRRK